MDSPLRLPVSSPPTGDAMTPDSEAHRVESQKLLPGFEPKFSGSIYDKDDEDLSPVSSPSRKRVPSESGDAFEHEYLKVDEHHVEHLTAKGKVAMLRDVDRSKTSDRREHDRYYLTPEPSSTLGRVMSECDHNEAPISESYDPLPPAGSSVTHPQIPSSPIYASYQDEEDDDDDDDESDAQKLEEKLKDTKKVNLRGKVTRLEYEYTEPQYDYTNEATIHPESKLPRSTSFASPSRAAQPFKVLSPLASLTVTMNIPRNGSEVTLGRSSKMCDFSLTSTNRLASRIHVRAQFVKRYMTAREEKEDEEGDHEVDENVDDDIGGPKTLHERVKFFCEGWNGCTIVVPTFKKMRKGVLRRKMRERANRAKRSSQSLAKEVSEADDMPDVELPDDHEFVYLPNGVTDYIVPHGHTLEVDYVEGITVEVRGDIVIVKLTDNDEAAIRKAQVQKTTVRPDAGYGLHNVESVTSTQAAHRTAVREEMALREKKSTKLNQQPSSKASKNVKKSETPASNDSLKRGSSLLKRKSDMIDDSSDSTHAKKRLSVILDDSKSSISLKDSSSSLNTNAMPKSLPAKPVLPSSPRYSEEPAEDVPPLEEAEFLHIQRLVSNHLAFSRLHTMPLSSVHNAIPSLKSVPVNHLRTVLGNTPWVGIVPRQGKDAAGRPLEEQYYYINEKDEDMDRKNMVEKIGARGAGGLRACRKTHKQYYWKMPAKR